VADRATIEAAGRVFVRWVVWELDLRMKARRPFAIIDGEVLDSTAVIYHCPEAIR